MSSCYNTLINQERPYVQANFWQKINESTPIYEKELKRQQSINALKDEINIPEKRQNELNDDNKNIHNLYKILAFVIIIKNQW